MPLKGNGGGESDAKDIAAYIFCSEFAQIFLFVSFFILKAEGDWRRKSGTPGHYLCKPRRVYTQPRKPEIIFVCLRNNI